MAKSNLPNAKGAVFNSDPLRWSRPDKYAIDREKMSAAIYYLNQKERLFVANVASGMGYDDSAFKAGFRLEGVALRNKAFQLMKRPMVRAAIYQTVAQTFGRASIQTEQTLRELASIAFMPDHMIEGRPRYQDKLRALEILARFQRLLDKHLVVEGEVSVVGLIVNSAKRERALVEATAATSAEFVEKPAERDPQAT